MLHIKHSTSLFYEVLVPSVIFFHEWVGIKQGCEKLILTLLASTHKMIKHNQKIRRQQL